MKRLFLGALAFTVLSAWSPAETGSALLARLPPPPGNVCQSSPEEEKAYWKQVNLVARDINAALADLKKEQRAHVKQNEAAWREEMLKQSGLTQEQIDQAMAAQKSPDRKARAAAKRKIAEQALEQYADLTIDEARQLKIPKKGADGTRPPIADARTKAYATQELAQAQAKVQAQTPEEQAAAETKRERLDKLRRVADEQKKLLDRTTAVGDVVLEKMRELDASAQVDYAQRIGPIDQQIEVCRKEIRRLADEINRRRADAAEAGTSPGDAAKANAAANEETERKISEWRKQCEEFERQKNEALGVHCEIFSPTYCGLIREYIDWAKGAQVGFARHEEMENEKFMLQMDMPGVPLMKAPGVLGLESAKACVDLLRTAFKYAKGYHARRANEEDPSQIGAAP